MKVQELAESFNNSLLQSETSKTPSVEDSHNNEDEDLITMSCKRDYTFYKSNQWEEFVDKELASIKILQPQIPHKVHQPPTESCPPSGNQCSYCRESAHNRNNCPLIKFKNKQQAENQTPANTSVPADPTGGILVNSTVIGNFTVWSFPSGISQSTICGRMGSNACTLITLLIAKAYFTKRTLLQLSWSILIPLLGCHYGLMHTRW